MEIKRRNYPSWLIRQGYGFSKPIVGCVGRWSWGCWYHRRWVGFSLRKLCDGDWVLFAMVKGCIWSLTEEFLNCRFRVIKQLPCRFFLLPSERILKNLPNVVFEMTFEWNEWFITDLELTSFQKADPIICFSRTYSRSVYWKTDNNDNHIS